MKIKFITSVLLILFMTTAGICAEKNPKDDAKTIFLKNLSIEILKTKDQANAQKKAEELVRQAVRQAKPQVVYDAVIDLSTEGISLIGEGRREEGEGFFIFAQTIAEMYALVHKREGLLDLVKKYETYNQEMFTERMQGISFVQQAGPTLEGYGQEALNYYQKALKVFKKLGDTSLEAEAFTLIGGYYIRSGHYTEAMNSLNQALGVYQELGYSLGEAQTLNNIGIVYGNLGLYKEALNNCKKALDIYQKLCKTSIDPFEAKILTNIGVIYNSLNRYSKAMECFYQALQILVGDESAEKACVYTNLGVTYYNLGQKASTLAYYQKALKVFQNLGDHPYEEANALANIGGVYNTVNNYPEASESYKLALAICEPLGDRETMWHCSSGLGESIWKSGKGEEAVPHYQKAVDTIAELYFSTRGLKEEERSSMLGDKSIVYQEFIELLLELNRQHPGEGYDQEAFKVSEGAKSRTFQELMAKAGAKIELSGDPDFKATVGKEQQLIVESNNLKTRLTQELSKPEKDKNQEVIASLKTQVSQSEQTLNTLWEEIERKYPRFAEAERPKPLSVQELQGLLNPGETLVSYAVTKEKAVAFIIGKESFKLIPLPTNKEELTGLLKQFRQGLEMEAVKVSWDQYVKNLEQFDPEVSYQLYQKLFAPLVPALQGKARLYLCADDVLYTLPFEALVDKEIDQDAYRQAASLGWEGKGNFLEQYHILHYLLDSYTLTYLPSSSVLRYLRVPECKKEGYGKWDKALIAFADPIFSETEKEEGETKGLPGEGITPDTALTKAVLKSATGSGEFSRLEQSAEEAKAIAGAVGGKEPDIYLRERATEANAESLPLKEARYLLFSTHGVLGGAFEGGVAEPSLVLTLIGNPPGKDGFLGMSKVLGLDLNNEVIILSACNTSGKGDKAGSGEGFAGLTRSFMYAGGKSLLVTHWSVDSEAAKDLMVDTMTEVKTKPLPESLRAAKLTMKGKTGTFDTAPAPLSHAHPYFWAPFVLVGEGK